MTAATKPKPMTTRELTDRLRRHYVKPQGVSAEWNGGIFIEEVGINGNASAQRRADAIYAGFTSASGRRLVGFEVKVSRSDWRNEMTKIGKADFWHDNCHQWYMVAPSTDIIPLEELPDGWGLIVPSGTGMKKVRVAVTRDVTPSWDALRSVLSRFDTERVNLINQARSEQDRVHQNQLHALRLELSGTGAARTDPEIQRLGKIFEAARARLRAGGGWNSASDDEVITALVDLATARRLADTLNSKVDHLISQLGWAAPRIDQLKAEIQAARKVDR